MRHNPREFSLEALEMLVALGQHERRSTVTHCLNDFVTDRAIPRLVVDKLLIQGVELERLVGVGASSWLEGRRMNNNRVLERPRRSLRLRVDPMPDCAALHEDDRMVTILARHSR